MDGDPNSNLSGPLDGLQGPKPTKKEARKPRFKTAQDAYNGYKDAREGDRLSAINRIRIQMQLDGAPPYDQAELIRRGLGTIANVNFGFMEDALNAASAPYENLIEAAEDICRMPTTFGRDQQERDDYNKGLAEEYTTLTLNNDNFDYNFAELVRQFLINGVAMPYYEQTRGINWQTTEMGNFLVNRDIPARESAIDCAFAVRDWLPYQLFRMIENPDTAKRLGWEVENTWKAIKAATPSVNYDDDWEKAQREWKDNDLGNSYSGKAKCSRLVHVWSRDLDGKVSHQMISAEGGDSGFLFQFPGRFERMSHCFTIFTNGVGTNGKYHGIRGIGYRLHAIVKEMNEIWSSFLDAMRNNSKVWIKPMDEAAIKNLQLVQFGNYMVMPPKADMVPMQFPDYTKGLIPGLQMLDQKLNGKVGAFSGQGAFDQHKEQTRTEILARVDEASKLGVSQMNIFYKAWTKLNRERVRRLTKVKHVKGDPDYDEVMEFFERCQARGIPKEAIAAIDLRKVQAVKVAGNGSQAALQATYDRLMQYIGELDAAGRNQLVRDAIRVTAGRDAANAYKPAIPGQRPPVDKKIAILENDAMAQGRPMQVEPNELHTAHMIEHLTGPGGLLEDLQALKTGQVGYEIIPSMRMKYDHCVGNPEAEIKGHMDYIPDKMPDGTPNMEKSGFNKALQEADEQIYNGEKHLEAEQKKLAAEQEQMPPEEGNELSPTDSRAAEQAEAALLKVEADAAAKDALVRQELEHNEIRLQQEMAEREARMAQQAAEADFQLATKAREATIKAAQPTQPTK
jgi:hypothetical protein